MSSGKIRLAILASGSGTNAEEIFRYFKNHDRIEVVLLMSNNPNAFALQRASNHGIKSAVFNREEFIDGKTILDQLRESAVTHIVLAGFLWLIPDYLLKEFPDRIINIHPALLPKYGGKGMYGSKVHEAVIANGEKESGITIHYVDEVYDHGDIILQERIPVTPGDTPQELAERIHELEHRHFPKVIERLIEK